MASFGALYKLDVSLAFQSASWAAAMVVFVSTPSPVVETPVVLNVISADGHVV